MTSTPQRTEEIATVFTERFIQTDGFQIRYLESGQGSPVVVLRAAEDLTPSPLNILLAQQFKVIAFEMPSFDRSPVNDRSQSMHNLAHTLTEAITALGIERYGLVSSALNASVALWLAIDLQERIDPLVLISPLALLPDGWTAPSGTAEQVAKLLYAHPEKLPPRELENPETAVKQRAFLSRLGGCTRDSGLERRLGEIKAATLVAFGTRDGVIPPTIGRGYVERIPNCYYALVYDAGHIIEAERPEALCAAVRDFLEHRETFVVGRRNTVINP